METPLGVRVHDKRMVEQIIDDIRTAIGIGRYGDDDHADVHVAEETDTGITLGAYIAGVPLTIDVHVTP